MPSLEVKSYYHPLRKTLLVLTEVETELFTFLERFYQQIYNNQVDSFSGMISLGNKRGQRLGYLHLFAGLVKLMKLGGLVYTDTPETKVPVEQWEVKWLNENLTALKGCRVFSEDEGDVLICPRIFFAVIASQDVYFFFASL